MRLLATMSRTAAPSGFENCPVRATTGEGVPDSRTPEYAFTYRPSLEGGHVGATQLKPFIVRALIRESHVPVALDIRRIVSDHTRATAAVELTEFAFD